MDPNSGEVIVRTNEMITFDHCRRIEAAGIKGANIRSVLTCRTQHGVCSKCYGSDMSSGKTVSIVITSYSIHYTKLYDKKRSCGYRAAYSRLGLLNAPSRGRQPGCDRQRE